MKSYFLIRIVAIFGFFVFIGSSYGIAQKNDKRWLRVITGEDYTTDIDRTSLVLVQEGIIGATFRTNEENPESVPGLANVKYRVRVDQMHFRTDKPQYKLAESKFFGSSDKILHSISTNKNDSWKENRTETGRRLFRAASQLSPFGFWKIHSFQYASGEQGGRNDPAELTSLIGKTVFLNPHRIVIADEQCDDPSFQPRTLTNDEFIKLIGSPFDALGPANQKIDAIILKCEGSKSFLPQTLIFRLPDERGLLLWEGVFFTIERPPNLFRPEIYY